MATPEPASIVCPLIGVFLGGIIGWLSGYFNSISVLRRQEFNKAAAEFRCAFVKELRYLDYRYSPDKRGAPGIYETLSNAFDTHEVAVIKFRPYLCLEQRISFDRAWDAYCDKGEDGKPRFIAYTELDELNDMIKARKFFLDKLNALLKFANLRH